MDKSPRGEEAVEKAGSPASLALRPENDSSGRRWGGPPQRGPALLLDSVCGGSKTPGRSGSHSASDLGSWS